MRLGYNFNMEKIPASKNEIGSEASFFIHMIKKYPALCWVFFRKKGFYFVG